MKETKNTFSEEKNNSVFSTKLRNLFAESGKTHGNLADYIKQHTGEGVTRQAIGQWCNGNTSPNLKTVPLIASFFGVSVDYLLTETEVKSADLDLKAVCNFTGLTEKAAQTLHDLTYIDDDIRLTVIYLLEQYADKLVDIIEATHEYGTFFFYNIDSILSSLSKYLRITPNEGIDRYYISESGRLINLMSTNLQEVNSKTDYRDIITSQDVDTKEIINRILLDSLEQSLKFSKKGYIDTVKKYPSVPLEGEVTLTEESITKIREKAEEAMKKISEDYPF